MVYKIEKTIGEEVIHFEIDDIILFDNQPKEFKKIFDKYKVCGEVEFDNAIVLLLPTKRVLITLKNEE